MDIIRAGESGMWTCIALAASSLLPQVAELPFHVKNGRGAAGIAFRVQADAKTPTLWKHKIRITVSGDQPQSTKDLRILPILLESESGEQAEVKVSGFPVLERLPPAEWFEVELSSAFKQPGVYTDELVLSQPPLQRVVPISVTVVAPPPPPALTALPLALHGGTAVALTEPLLGDAPTSLSIRVRNTGGETLDVEAALAGVARVDKLDKPTFELSTHAAAEPRVAKIEPDRLESFDVPLTGVDGPGIYSVEMLFRDREGKHQPYVSKTTVYRRSSWLAAAFWIALGAGLAWFVRNYVSDGSQRLALRRRLALIIEHVRAFRSGARNTETITAAQVFERDLEDVLRDVRSGGKLTEVEVIAARAELRLALLNEIGVALAQLERLDPERQVEARKTLDKALIAVRIDPGADDKIDAARMTVRQLELSAAFREQLTLRLAELKQQIEDQRRVGSDELDPELDKADAQLTKARNSLREDDLRAMEIALAKARDIVIDAAVAELGRILGGAAPFGFSTDEWSSEAAKVRKTLAGAEKQTGSSDRYALLVRAQHTYLTAVVERLASKAEELSKTNNEQAEELRMLASRLRTTLNTSVSDAAALYPDALAKIRAASEPKVGTGEVGILEEVTRALAMPFELSTPPATRSNAALEPVIALDRKISSSNRLVNFIVLVIAVASGVKALWVENPAWGADSAWLIAFLWGAGVQAAGDAFTGLLGLRANLGAPKSA